MSNEVSNVKIKLRRDTSSNWVQHNPVLQDGEVAIVDDGQGAKQIKIGNGISTFSQLPFLYQNEFQSSKYSSGTTNKVVGEASIATGVYTEVSANAAAAFGLEANVLTGHDYSFVYNGTNLPGLNDRYTSHGEGTFNINPKDGLSGFYIGENNLFSILKNYVLSSEFSIGYNASTQNIEFKYKDQILDTINCAAFLKDDLLNEVNLIDNKLVFKFTNSSIVPLSVNLSSFVDNYDSDISRLENQINNKVIIRNWH